MAVERTDSSVASRFATNRGDILHGGRVYAHSEIKAAGHEVNTLHFLKLHDLVGDFIETAVALWRDAQLNQGGGAVGICFFPS